MSVCHSCFAFFRFSFNLLLRCVLNQDRAWSTFWSFYYFLGNIVELVSFQFRWSCFLTNSIMFLSFSPNRFIWNQWNERIYLWRKANSTIVLYIKHWNVIFWHVENEKSATWLHLCIWNVQMNCHHNIGFFVVVHSYVN